MNSFPSVLYVEDDALSRMVVEIILKEVMGLSNIVIFKDSANFENQLNSIPFQVDLILLDIQVKPFRHDPNTSSSCKVSKPAYCRTHC